MLVGVDVGGTFTDAMALVGGELRTWKGTSTPEGLAAGFLNAFDSVAGTERSGWDVRHATTAATNAVLTRSGATTALVTTAGFRDMLEMGRLRFPKLYDLTWRRPEPLVPRRRRIEVPERMDASGHVLQRPDIPTVLSKISALIELEDLRAVAISLINAHVNDRNERAILEAIATSFPQLTLTLGSWVSTEPGEFERSSTATINGFVGPVLAGYLNPVRDALKERGVQLPPRVMRSNGDLVALSQALRLPAFVMESGPAAGIIAATALGAAIGERHVLSLDIGGTTAKACIIADGAPTVVPQYWVGGETSSASRLLGGNGFPIQGPSMDIAEIGAGGGSIIRVTAGGRVTVGPMSAGASPGPACYGLGGALPTVTDAHLIVGHLQDGDLLGGSIRIDREASLRVIHDHVAKRLGCTVTEAAHGCLRVANAAMLALLRGITVERGLNPAEMALMAYGGGGALHAAELARGLGIRSVIVPPRAGIFSALGLLIAKIAAERVRSIRRPLQAVADQLGDWIQAAKLDLLPQLRENGIDVDQGCWELTTDVRNLGQGHIITLPILEDTSADDVEKRYRARYLELFRIEAGQAPLELVDVRVRASSSATPPRFHGGWFSGRPAAAGGREERQVYWGQGCDSLSTPVIPWDACGTTAIPGPLIIRAPDTTVTVPPGASWRVADNGHGLLTALEPSLRFAGKR